MTPAEFVDIKHRLTQIIDEKTDSTRFYLLGKNWQRRVETLGRSDSYDPDKGVLLL